MKRGKYEAPYVPMGRGSKKVLAMLLSLVLVIGCVVGGTLAWLVADSQKVTNTFTTSDITVELVETEEDFKMIPGHTIEKDPKVTVKAGSEACWLFVELKKSENFDQYLTYKMADGWELVEGQTNIYARKVETADIGTAYSVLKDDQVTVKEEVTKDMMTTAKTKQPTLTFTAYAVQLYKANNTEFTAVDAWDKVDRS